jgi:hypothetical protein
MEISIDKDINKVMMFVVFCILGTGIAYHILPMHKKNHIIFTWLFGTSTGKMMMCALMSMTAYVIPLISLLILCVYAIVDYDLFLARKYQTS